MVRVRSCEMRWRTVFDQPAMTIIRNFSPRMALASKMRRAENAAGNLYVDASCIDCDTCRWMAPETYGRAGTKSVVYQQPSSVAQKALALAAVVACPTGSIRTETNEPAMRSAVDSFPLPIDAARLPNVYHLGYPCRHSFGATPYLLRTPAANVVVDAPRFSGRLARQLDAIGGVDHMLLTHMDDVGDMNRWKQRYPGMNRVMHAADVRTAAQWPYIDMTAVETQLDGDGPWALDGVAGVTIVGTPGHSRGSLSFLADAAVCGGGEGAVFTGDHFCFSGRLGRLDGMARYGWDVATQAESIAKLADLDFLWVLPGHGRRARFASAAERAAAMRKAAREFAADPLGQRAPGYVAPETEAARQRAW